MNRLHRWYCHTNHWRGALQGRLLPWALQGARLGDDVLEIGPGPGMATEWLAPRVPRLTSLEIDPTLARALRARAPAEVDVVCGDATAMELPDGRFSSALCFTMLHHVPTPALQDRLLAEAWRVLRPGGWLYGSDSRGSALFTAAHLFDTLQLVDPERLPERLAAVGFDRIAVDTARTAFRFRARRPPAAPAEGV